MYDKLINLHLKILRSVGISWLYAFVTFIHFIFLGAWVVMFLSVIILIIIWLIAFYGAYKVHFKTFVHVSKTYINSQIIYRNRIHSFLRPLLYGQFI